MFLPATSTLRRFAYGGGGRRATSIAENGPPWVWGSINRVSRPPNCPPCARAGAQASAPLGRTSWRRLVRLGSPGVRGALGSALRTDRVGPTALSLEEPPHGGCDERPVPAARCDEGRALHWRGHVLRTGGHQDHEGQLLCHAATVRLPVGCSLRARKHTSAHPGIGTAQPPTRSRQFGPLPFSLWHLRQRMRRFPSAVCAHSHVCRRLVRHSSGFPSQACSCWPSIPTAAGPAVRRSARCVPYRRSVTTLSGRARAPPGRSTALSTRCSTAWSAPTSRLRSSTARSRCRRSWTRPARAWVPGRTRCRRSLRYPRSRPQNRFPGERHCGDVLSATPRRPLRRSPTG